MFYAVIYNERNIEVARHERPTLTGAIKALEFYVKFVGDWGIVEDEDFRQYAMLQYRKELTIR